VRDAVSEGPRSLTPASHVHTVSVLSADSAVRSLLADPSMNDWSVMVLTGWHRPTKAMGLLLGWARLLLRNGRRTSFRCMVLQSAWADDDADFRNVDMSHRPIVAPQISRITSNGSGSGSGTGFGRGIAGIIETGNSREQAGLEPTEHPGMYVMKGLSVDLQPTYPTGRGRGTDTGRDKGAP